MVVKQKPTHVSPADRNTGVLVTGRNGNHAPEVETLTHDEILRANIRKFVGSHVNDLPDKVYQFRLSKLLARVECTETGNAIRFAARYGHVFRFQAESEKWIMWNGRYWEEDVKQREIMAHAMKVAAYIDMEADLIPPPTDENGEPLLMPLLAITDKPTPEQQAVMEQFAAYERQKESLKKWALTSRSKRGLCDMVELFKAMEDITMMKAQFDADTLLLNCQNGILDLRTGNVQKHNRYHFMTRVISTSAKPGAGCPHWLKFLDKVMLGNAELVSYLQLLAGMGLTGERYEDVFPVFHGNGGNGKTVFIEVLRRVLGGIATNERDTRKTGYADMATPEMFMEQKNESSHFDLAGLDGIRLLFKDETKQGRQLDEGMVKSMTGGSPMKAAFKFKDYFTFMPQFTPILATNHKPRIVGNDEGIWRRVKLVPWEYNFNHDPEKKSKPEAIAELMAEADGILMWMFAGLQQLLTEGYTEPETVKIKTQEYRADSDDLGAFLSERCIMEQEAKVPLSDLYVAYKNYMEDAGAGALKKSNLSTALAERGFEKGRGTGGTWQWLGIRLRGENEPVPESKPAPAPAPVQATLTGAQEQVQKPLPACPYCHTNSKVHDNGDGSYGCMKCAHLFTSSESK